MVWIHGGSYTAGGIGPLVGVFNGSSNVALADDLIIVTVQYRLGILGFAWSSGLTGRNADGSTGNYGIQDQRAAMAWVSTPTEGFGGNASNVMIVGESAGAGSESMHLTMPESFGYSSKVGLESGAWSCWTAQPMSEAEQQLVSRPAGSNQVQLCRLLGGSKQQGCCRACISQRTFGRNPPSNR